MQGNLSEILERLGRDIALPGVDLAIELLQQLRADLMAGAPAETEPVVATRRGRPLKPGSRSWGNLTAEERSAEMKRRMAVAQAKRGKTIKIPGLHPRDPKHPGHDAWIEKMKAAQRKAWDSMSPAQQKAKNRKMLKARQASQTTRTAVNEIQAAS